MVSAYYSIMLAIAIVLMLAYFTIWHKHFDINITLIFVLVPIANLGYYFVSQAKTLDMALTATKITYIGGCYLIYILMLTVYLLCNMELKRPARIALLCLCTAVYLSVLTIGSSPIYYVSASLEQINGVSILNKEYGPAHSVFIAMQIGFLCATFVAVIYSYLRKNQVSRKILFLLFLTDAVGTVCFFGGRRLLPSIELLPFAYDFALAVYLIISYRLSLYDVSDSAIDSMVQTGYTGFVSFDYDLNYLGSNQIAKDVFPQLNDLTVDKSMESSEFVYATMLPWIQSFSADMDSNIFLHEKGEKVYQIHVEDLYSGRRKRGYQLFITDNTEVQRYIKLLNSFNTELQSEVEKKTAHIVQMHDNLVMSMAVMVESRDNSTGGHIRRTSEGVRLLVEQMREDPAWDLSEEFCRDVIKAAPMHDLGKIAVDDAVLRKPGRFTPEEFNKMKAHAAEGARIVHEILLVTDDDAFHHIAENVAHYHHERWDGSGYPDGLAGEDIPLEARIMAIADVYDALVSKRVYKEAMSFEKADAIIMDGMGTQFDKSLEPYYIRARPHLEQYYRSLEG